MNAPPRCRHVERRDEVSASNASDGDVVGTITLDETDRHRRRTAMTSDQGLAFVLALDNATLLRDGDRLVLEDGRRVVVHAAPEPLYEVRARDPHHLLRLAWHMGNRHLPTQLMDDHLRIRRDAVIGAMLTGLGATIRDVEAGFDPEGGAYGDAAGGGHAPEHAHHHVHARGHEHDRTQGHSHDPGHGSSREHAHGHSHEHASCPAHEHARDHPHEHVSDLSHEDANEHLHEGDDDSSHEHAHRHSRGDDHDDTDEHDHLRTPDRAPVE